jgi:hypothetical protein
MHISLFALVGILALAFLAGFASHRGSLCAVKAVDELLQRRRPRVAASFVRAALWAMLAATLLNAVWPAHMMAVARYPFTLIGALGALAFGIGAAVNGACALSTLSRLATGEVSKASTLLGFAVGAYLCGLLFHFGLLTQPQPMAAPRPSVAILGWVALGGLGLALSLDLLWHLRKPFARAGWRGVVLARQHRPIFAAALLGISGGALAWALGPWSYTALARAWGFALAEVPAHEIDVGLLLLLFAFAAGGASVSAGLRGGWRWRFGALRAWGAAFSGGVCMGFGIATVPGGNDELLLVSFAALSPHAAPSYGMLLAGIALVLGLRRPRA